MVFNKAGILNMLPPLLGEMLMNFSAKKNIALRAKKNAEKKQ